MKTESWISALKELDQKSYGKVKLIADGINVSFSIELIKRKLRIFFYVDGVWKGEFMDRENPFGQKFGRAKIWKPSAKQIKLEGLINGRAAATKFKKHREVLCYYPDWGTSRALISHLKKTCKEITVDE